MPKYARWTLVFIALGAFMILGASQFGWGDATKLMGGMFSGIGVGIWMGKRMKD